MGEGSAREHIPACKAAALPLAWLSPEQGALSTCRSRAGQEPPSRAGHNFFLLTITISEVPKSTAPTPTAAMSSAGASRVLGAAGPAQSCPGAKPGLRSPAPILPGPAPSPAAGGVLQHLRSLLAAALPASSSRDRVRVDVVEEEELGAHHEAQLLLEEGKEKRVRAGNRGGRRTRSFGGGSSFFPQISHVLHRQSDFFAKQEKIKY